MASAPNRVIERLHGIGFDDRARGIGVIAPIVFFLANLFVGGYWLPAAQATYIISQKQSFSSSDQFIQISQQGYLGNYQYSAWVNKTLDLKFYGAPSSMILAGNLYELTGIKYNLSANASYAAGVYSVDNQLWSDTWTLGYFAMQHWVSDAFILPNQENSLSYHNGLLYCSDVNDDPFAFMPGQGGSMGSYGQALVEPMEQEYFLTKDKYDLSLFYVEDFAIQLWRILYLELKGWDSDDEYSGVYISNYSWEGAIAIDYLYDPASTNPVPGPTTILLLGSGLAGLAGFRKGFKRS